VKANFFGLNADIYKWIQTLGCSGANLARAAASVYSEAGLLTPYSGDL